MKKMKNVKKNRRSKFDFMGLILWGMMYSSMYCTPVLLIARSERFCLKKR